VSLSRALRGRWEVAAVAVLCIALGLPSLLAYNLPPSPTALNQALAVGAWGLVLGVVTWRTASLAPEALRHPAAALFAALVGVAMAALVAWLSGHLPSALALSAAGLVVVAAITLAAAASMAATRAVWLGVFAALLAAGLCSTFVGALQVFAPDAAAGSWLARSGIPGRAVGNLRQPNHLATLLLWSAVAVVPLLSWSAPQPARAAGRWTLAALFALMLFGVVLSGSRTGLLGVVWLVAWGLLDRALPRLARALLIASPLICLAGNALLSWWGSLHNLGALGMSTRVGETDISNARFSIWSNALALIADQPWLGVGFGNFNFAWTLTPFPDRNPQFFDHAHNLPLHLAVELGVPLALLVVGLLLWGLWQAFVRSRGVPGPQGIARRAGFVMVLMMGWHSMLEYPLWYAYFLLPTAFMWGLCLRPHEPVEPDTPAHATRPAPWLAAGGVAMIVAAAVTLWDYSRVVAIFAPRQDNRATLVERIVEGRHSWFFAHHADYALVTTIDGAAALPGAFDRATHFLLDTRLMIAWARGLAARGDVDRARHIAARLREFRNPGAAEFFAPCDDATLADKPFQCSPPERRYGWRDFAHAK
jgi:O-antigen ligase